MAKTNKWVTPVLAIALVASIGVAAHFGVEAEKSKTTKTISALDWDAGKTINAAGKSEDDAALMKTSKMVTTDGLEIELAKKSKVTYKLAYYNEDREFISLSTVYSTDFDDSASIPAEAKYAYVIADPADEDGKITVFEKLDYAKEISITYAK